jgi:hypothetical protein
MNCHFHGWVLGAAAALYTTIGVVCGAKAIQSEGEVYDKIVYDFIRFDIGQVRDPLAAEQIKYRFNRLRTDDAVPSLVRGLNASTRMRASCPITAISSKLRGIVSRSRNPEVGTFLLQNLDRNNAGPYAGYVDSLFNVAEAQVVRTMGNGLAEQRFKRQAEEDSQRLVYTPGMMLTDLTTREAGEPSILDASRDSSRTQKSKVVGSRSVATRKSGREAASATSSSAYGAIDWTKLGIEELIGQLGDRSLQARALAELFRRASDGDEQWIAESVEPIVRCLSEGDDSARESAARLLGLLRVQQATEPLIDTLGDSNAKVRSAAATALTRITRQLYGPSDDATPEDRQAAVARWRDWLSRQRK